MQNQDFFFDQGNLPTEEKLWGYTFSGTHFVCNALLNPNSTPFEADSDGCYAHVRLKSDCAVLETDYRGYFPVYFYQSGDKWAICSSFRQLVQIAKNRG
ncbi:hypothetical protein [uncultured Microbulbifer sp.]|uniref:hypothetical protein n=1 Tax=uncultured Microbulbifer sp. TaxID=348147 RepID=UPI00260C3A3A|nr:hypothetical protein [uncultured Microbulbifer sp.]